MPFMSLFYFGGNLMLFPLLAYFDWKYMKRFAEDSRNTLGWMLTPQHITDGSGSTWMYLSWEMAFYQRLIRGYIFTDAHDLTSEQISEVFMWQLFLQPLNAASSLVGIPLSIYFSLCWTFLYIGAYFIKMMFDQEKL